MCEGKEAKTKTKTENRTENLRCLLLLPSFLSPAQRNKCYNIKTNALQSISIPDVATREK